MDVDYAENQDLLNEKKKHISNLLSNSPVRYAATSRPLLLVLEVLKVLREMLLFSAVLNSFPSTQDWRAGLRNPILPRGSDLEAPLRILRFFSYR